MLKCHEVSANHKAWTVLCCTFCCFLMLTHCYCISVTLVVTVFLTVQCGLDHPNPEMVAILKWDLGCHLKVK